MGLDPSIAWGALQDVPVGITVFRLEDERNPRSLRLLFGNETATSLLGFDISKHVERMMVDIFPATPRDRVERYAQVARSGQAMDFGVHTIDVSNVGRVEMKISASCVAPKVVAIYFDNFTARRAAESEVRELSQFLDSIVENIPTMVFVKDAKELRFKRFNRAAEALIGVSRDQMLGKNDFDFFPKEQAEFFQAKDRQVLAGKDVVEISEEPIQTASGERWLRTKKIPIFGPDGSATYLLGISEDITERRRIDLALRASNEELERRVAARTAELERINEELRQQVNERLNAEEALKKSEAQLLHSQKMEAVGRLAGGIAHDFNNLLSVILSYSEVLISEMRHDDPMRTELSEIKEAGERAARLTRQLLAFSRQQVLAPRLLDLNDVVAGAERMLRRLIGEDIDLVAQLEPNLGRARLDPGQIEQVIMNLAVNARDAMPNGGKLTIETGNVEIDQTYAKERLDVVAGPHVMLAVSDTGVGMDRETMTRIFEPFFTTKETGKGTGLGLSTVFGIVKQSGGHIFVYSELGRGTVFKLYFPISEGSGDLGKRGSKVPTASRSATVLLVEDDDRVRSVARMILRRAGMTVIDASGPQEAMRVFATEKHRIDLILTDVVMPGSSGPEMVNRLREMRPDVKVVFMSGYTDDAIVRHGVLEEGTEFVQKPLTPEALIEKLRAVLGTR